MRLIFMGTPDFAVPTLEALAAAGHEVVAAYSQPPRPAGRGKKDRPSPVQLRAEALGIEVRTPARLRDPAALAALADLEADAAVVVAYGVLLPKAALEAPRLGCFNAHASLLPRWRGAAPIQRAILAGDAETGVCVMRMTEGLDEGPVFARAATPIGPRDDAGALHDRLAAMSAELMVDALARLADGAAAETPQPDEGVVYARKIDKAEARIDWTRDAVEIDRQIRAFSPAPGAWAELDGERLKILAATVAPAREATPDAAPGVALDARLLIACGAGAVRLERVQRAGRGPTSAEEFLRGRPTPEGARLT